MSLAQPEPEDDTSLRIQRELYELVCGCPRVNIRIEGTLVCGSCGTTIRRRREARQSTP